MTQINKNIAVGYVRCSTILQDESVQQQKDEIKRWAEQNEYTIKRWYEDEGRSGTTFEKRPGFRSLQEAVENKPDFQYVLVYDESRWGRADNPRDNSYWKMHFEHQGVFVRVINSQSKNGNDVGSYIMEVVESAEASEYVRKLSRATLRGQRATAEGGFSSGGSAPYGYRRVAIDKDTGNKTRDLPHGTRSHPEEKVRFELGSVDEVQTVRRMFELRLQGLGYRAIANTLNEANIPCPRRGRWKNKDQKWSGVTIYTILTNRTYTGARIFNRHPQSHLSGPSKKAWINDPSEWTIKENAHPAIISKEAHDAVNKDRKPYQRTNRFFVKSEYLLSGLVKCSRCGFAFQGQTHSVTMKNGKQQRYGYYEDSGYINKGNAVCHSYLIRQDRLEDTVIGALGTIIKSAGFAKGLKTQVRERLQNAQGRSEQVTDLKTKLSQNEKSVQNLIRVLSNGSGLEEIHLELKRLEKERDYLKVLMADAEQKDVSQRNIQVLVEQIDELIDGFSKTLKTAPFHMQKNLIRHFVDHILVDREGNHIVCYLNKVPSVNNALLQKLSDLNGDHSPGSYLLI